MFFMMSVYKKLEKILSYKNFFKGYLLKLIVKGIMFLIL